ncbi:PA14 domain-containing protein [Deinococcus misasensis]|uniref:PA14 domain-containing protein n=1 Tax=Deinococcus misasensis TaxID=392413 RepID=UPI000557A2FC|nr:PA14 domain-containing protein [Deinococcus misasensis]
MKEVQKYVLLLGALGLSACGMFQTPTKPTSPTTETTPNTNFDAQGTPIVCTNQSAGGNFPYNLNGPLWRQQFFLNDNGTPLNYSTFSTDLPAVGNISMNPYVYNSTGGTYTPGPWMYQHIYAPNVILTGTQTNGAAANNIVVTASGNYGLSYNASLKQFDLPVVSSSNKFKLYDAAGNLLPTEYGGSQTSMPSINGRVRIPTGQKVTLEFYLDPNVQYRPELIWATFKDASGVTKTDWVKVTMPYQEGILKVNAATYTVQEPTGIKTYQSAVNPLPKFKFVMRGYNNLVSSDRPFLNRQGIYYTWPSSVPSGNWTAWNQFMDERKDFVLNWNLYDQKVGSASVDASGNPVVNAATVTTPAQWNLGTPGYANDKNCISKTFAPESGSQQWFSVIQPAATVFSGATFTETQQGLKAEYFDNPDFTGKRVERLDSQINFNWGGYSPAPFISPETYSIRWSGSITPSYSEQYTFYFTGGSGMRLLVNGKTVIDQWDAPLSVATGTITLKAGVKYPIELQYQHPLGNAQAILEWSSMSQSRSVMDSSVFSPIPVSIIPVYKLRIGAYHENSQFVSVYSFISHILSQDNVAHSGWSGWILPENAEMNRLSWYLGFAKEKYKLYDNLRTEDGVFMGTGYICSDHNGSYGLGSKNGKCIYIDLLEDF